MARHACRIALLSSLALWPLWLLPAGLGGPAQDPPEPGGVEPPAPSQDPPQDPPEDIGQRPDTEGQDELAQDPAEEEEEEIALPGALSWAGELARDKLISFSLRSAVDASAALARPEGSALYRAGAWIALGKAGSPGDRALIVREARVGEGLERRAAILALGESQGDETSFLASIAEDHDISVVESAMLALLRSRLPRARKLVEAFATVGADDPRSVLATTLLDYDRDPEHSPPPRSVRTLVHLRFEAARAFGMIDGTNFAAGRIAELAANREFVSSVVLRASVHLSRGAVRDHLLAALLEGTAKARLAPVVDALPRQLSMLVESGLWKPRDAGEWSAILDEIERQRVEALTPELLKAAEEVSGMRYRARALASRSQRVDLEALSQTEFANLPVEDRIEIAQAIGSSIDPAARESFQGLDRDEDLRVRGAVLVAKMRLGDRSAISSVEKILFDRTEAEHEAVLLALCRNAREAGISLRLEEFERRAAGADLATVAAALTVQTRASGRATARSLLGLDSPPRGERRFQIVRALSRRPVAQDLEVFLDLFPQPEEEELNLELAASLAALSAPVVRPILRAGLWHGSFDESILAAFLLANASGVRTLVEEIQRPPPGATSADLRRVGFALGEWGGIEAMELLRNVTGTGAGPEMQGALLGALGSRTQ